MKTRKGNDKLLVKSLMLKMKHQERKMDTLRQKNKCMTSVLSSHTVKRLKEIIFKRARKIIQLKEDLTPQRKRVINARRRANYQHCL